jgi:hypothetical protein
MSDYRILHATGSEIFEIANRLDTIGTRPSKDLASCLGILLLAVKHGYISECKESLVAFARQYQLHPDGNEPDA